ncbi:MAG: NAD(P)/FAD-dependent oxidoreductase, partial [Firmicutes bacterium]|nr:NAD(P)/FAD-dependent oxidoreductase [Bacillota bacterium]
MQTEKKRVIVIGAGAAGMLAAGTAGSRGAEVFLIEKNDRPGRKMLLTGKGRCNITNNTDVQGLIAGVPVNGKFLYSAFHAFSTADLLTLLKNLGLKIRTERGRRVFPVSDRAADVVNTLSKFVKQNKVHIERGEVARVLTGRGKVEGVLLKDGTEIRADSVIVATGGLSYPSTGSTGDGYRFAAECGHSLAPLEPSLVPLEIKEKWVRELQGLSLRNVSVRVYNRSKRKLFEDFGEMLFTHYGVSGPTILSASSSMREIDRERYALVIDLKPALSEEQLDRRIRRDFTAYSRKIFANSLHDLLPQKLIPVIIALSGIPREKRVHQITQEERAGLVTLIKNLTLHVHGFRPLEEAIITSGGVRTREINPSTMESRIVRGLFFAGEVIDVDG